MGPHLSTLFENSPKTHLWPKGAPKSLPAPFSRRFEGMPAFALPLVLLRLLVNLLAFGNSGFSVLRRVYTFGLDGPSRIHSNLYHEVEIQESGAFERGQR
jgi:hypothetical protein